MKKIALLHYAYPPNIGGVEILIKEQAHILADLGYEVQIFTGFGKEENKKIKLTQIKEFQSLLNINPKLQEKIINKGIIDEEFYDFAEKIEKKLKEHLKNIDTIIIHNMLTIHRNLPFVYAFHKYAKKHPEKRIIIWVHDHVYIGEGKVKNLEKIKGYGESELERFLLTTPIQNGIYVVISKTFKKLLLQVMNIPKSNVRVIPNGINIKRFLEINNSIWEFLEKYALISSFPIVLSPVNILERKNIEYSLELIFHLKKIFPKIAYTITGQTSKHRQTEDYFKKIKKMIKKLKLEKNVFFLHREINRALNDQEIHDLYQLSDLVFYFSKSENFGLPILEASITKTPIFTSNLEVFKEIADDLINIIDFKTTPPNKAAKIIADFIRKNKLIKLNFLTRTKYNLVNIIKEKLVPLL